MTTHPAADLHQIIRELEDIRRFVIEREVAYAGLIRQVWPHYRESARNLVHYMALRSFDLRPVQEELSMLSISSLGHSEGYTLTNLNKILHILHVLLGEPLGDTGEDFQSEFNYYRSKQKLHENSLALFGHCERNNCTKIMVTMDTEAAYNFRLIKLLVSAGMDIARINTCHDQPDEWLRMIENIRRAERETGRSCLINIDLAGPKLRTRDIDVTHTQFDKKGPYLRLHVGDTLRVLHQLPQPGSAVSAVTLPPSVTVTLPSIFADVRVDQEVYFDDGKIGGAITDIDELGFTIRITLAGTEGSKLRADKGFNLPDTDLRLPSLTETDHGFIPFVAEHADIVGYSFVRRPDDVELLQRKLKDMGREDIGLILKIETKEAFSNLPRLLLTAMRSPKVGVMIARGDLAVEVGFERVAEVQEEILWICEAAHVPGIWATQVLDKLAKKGIATRAEITDAAMSARAECVMLNKGPYIVKAVATLDDIIRRMEKHQFKRKSNLRPLRVAQHFLESDGWMAH